MLRGYRVVQKLRAHDYHLPHYFKINLLLMISQGPNSIGKDISYQQGDPGRPNQNLWISDAAVALPQKV